MKYCGNCGSKMEDNEKYCGNCGEKFTSDIHENVNVDTGDTYGHGSSFEDGGKYNKGKLSWIKVLAWIIFFPFMLLFTIITTSKLSKKMKIGIILALIALIIILPKEEQPTTAGVDTELNDNEVEAQENSTQEINEPEVSEIETQDAPENIEIIEGIENNDVARNITEASNQINLDIQQAKRIEQEDPWAGGDRYSLSYEGNRVLIYMNGDDTVNSINIGDIKIYEQGYEPLDITKYLTTSEMNAKVATMSEDLVKRTLNYPETAKFPWLDWGYARANDIYAVSSHVEAKNAFGVESKIPFYIEFKLDETTTKPAYVVLDGEVVLGSERMLKTPEKIPLEADLTEGEEPSGFSLEYGVLGDYGKEENINGNKEIYYHVPAGRYEVSTTMNNAALIVLKKEAYTNSDGYTEHETVSMNRFDSATNTREIEIGENEKIMVTVQSRFVLSLIE